LISACDLTLNLDSRCRDSSVTKELLEDFFDFDFRQWAAMLIKFNGTISTVIPYLCTVRLYTWFQAQVCHLNPNILVPLLTTVKVENVENYFGPGTSLSIHHSCSWEVAQAVDLTCKYICDLENYGLAAMEPEKAKAMAAAITHPQIVDYSCVNNQRVDWDDGLSEIVGHWLDFNEFTPDNTELVELQNYLRDPERAGRYIVHGGTYATLSVMICERILCW
jgi:hypothetical protein